MGLNDMQRCKLWVMIWNEVIMTYVDYCTEE
jgi:hypothetical protein